MRHVFATAAGLIMLVSPATLAQSAGQAAGQSAGATELVPAPQRTQERVTLDNYERPNLLPGDKAPAPALGTFIKGASFDSFAPGQVYVMEFWATWCGPCIRGFPHLSELQKKHGDKVQIVGVNIWERDSNYDSRVQTVTNFVNARDDMGYTVAIDKQDKGSEKNWMQAAGRNSIPSAFIVDGQGRIAWIGHPMAMDEPLQQVIDGKLDTAALAKSAAEEHLAQAWAEAIVGAMQQGRWDAAYATAHEKLDNVFKNQPELLNQLAWVTITHPAFEGNRDLLFAKAAAEQAAKATDRKDADVLDTLARAHWELGEKDQAIRTQQEAVQAADDPEMKSALEETLENYQSQGQG